VPLVVQWHWGFHIHSPVEKWYIKRYQKSRV
jgi:hypothetical protein